jgi:hypothetical protein
VEVTRGHETRADVNANRERAVIDVARCGINSCFANHDVDEVATLADRVRVDRAIARRLFGG